MRSLTVTGHRGYIGQALWPALLAAGERPFPLHGRIEHVSAQGGGIALRCIHLACDTRGSFATNVYGTAAVVNAMARGGRLVFASTVTSQAPADTYDCEKLLGEQIAISRPDLDVVILRLGSVYGEPILPNKRSALNQMMAQAAAGDDLELYGNSLACRDFVHVSDVARAFVVALNAPSGVYDVGTGIPHTLVDAAKLVAGQAGVRCDLSPAATDHHHPIATENRWLSGWMPEVRLEDGIAHALDWLREKEAAGALERHTLTPAAGSGVARAA
jgi:nucleoside-diphosphate-sugar epimerase